MDHRDSVRIVGDRRSGTDERATAPSASILGPRTPYRSGEAIEVRRLSLLGFMLAATGSGVAASCAGTAPPIALPSAGPGIIDIDRSKQPPYVREMLADGPLGHWRLSGDTPGAIANDVDRATTFDGGKALVLPAPAFGGTEGAVELWLRDGQGTVASYAARGQPEAFVLRVSDHVEVTLAGASAYVAAAPSDGRWHHISVSWSALTGLSMVAIDGLRIWRGPAPAGGLTGGGTFVLGARQGCVGGCLRSHFVGALDEVAVHSAAVHSSRFLSHVNVATGWLPPTPVEPPVEFAVHQSKTPLSTSELAMSPDSRLALTAGDQMQMRDVATGKLIRSFDGDMEVAQIAFSPDGRLAAAGGDFTKLPGNRRRPGLPKTMIEVFDVSSGRRLYAFDEPRARMSVEAIAFAPEGRRIAAATSDGLVQVWDLPTGDLICTTELWQGDAKPWVRDAKFGLDGRTLITIENAELGSNDESKYVEIRYLDAATCRGTGRIDRIPGYQIVSFGPKGRTAVAGGTSGITLWDVARRRGLRAMVGHTDRRYPSFKIEPRTVAISPNGRLALSGACPNSRSIIDAIELWNLSTGRKLDVPAFAKFRGCVNKLLFSDDGLSALSIEGNGTVRSWDLRTGRESRPPPVAADSTGNPVFSSDGRYVLFSQYSFARGQDRQAPLRLWDLVAGRPVHTMLGHDKQLNATAMSADARYALSGGQDRSIRLWDQRTGRQVGSFRGIKSQVHALAFSPDGKLALSGHGQSSSDNPHATVTLWNVETGRPVRRLESYRGSSYGVAFSPDGRFGLIDATHNDKDPRMIVWDLRTGKTVRSLKVGVKSAFQVAFSPDARYVFLSSYGGESELWDLKRRRRVAALEPELFAAALSSDGKLAYANDSKIYVRDIRNNRIRFETPETFTTDIAFSPDGRFLLAVHSSFHVASIFDLKRATRVSSMISAGDEWILFDDDGNFDASPQGTGLLSAVKGTQSFGIDQLALSRNRPELILERLHPVLDPQAEMSASRRRSHRAWLQRAGFVRSDINRNVARAQSLRAHFRAVHRRRLDKAGFAEQGLQNAPVELPNARVARLGAPTDDGFVTLRAEFRDRVGLKSYQVFVNDVPVHPRGRPLSGPRASVDERLELSGGMNKIEVSALNSRGQESMRAIRYAERPSAPRGDLYFIGFGVSEYADTSGMIQDLQYAHQDALDLADYFRATKNHFDQVHVQTFVNDEVRVDSVDKAIAFLRKSEATVHDTLVLFVAGHGLRAHDDVASYYYLAHDSTPSDLAGSGIPFERLEALLFDSKPRKKLFLLDTCQSGEGREVGERTLPPLAAGIRPRAIRGLRRIKTQTRAQLAVDLGILGLDRDRFVHLDLARRSGAIVFSSSLGREYSFEHADWRNGAFTEELLKALRSRRADQDRDGLVSTDELRAYVIDAVPKLTRDVRGRPLQHPTVDKDNIYVRFGFPIVEPPP